MKRLLALLLALLVASASDAIVFINSYRFGGYPFSTPNAQYNLADLSDSAGSFTLTDHGTVTFVAGKVGNAANFNGTGQWLTSSANVANADFTVVLWVNISADQTKYLATQWGDGVSSDNNRWQCYVDTDETVSFAVAATGSSSVTTAALSTDTWHFLALQWNNTSRIVRIKVDDGAWTSNEASSVMANPGVPAPFSLGGSGDGSLPLAGKIDAVRVFNSIISDAELTALYNAGSGIE